MPTVAAIRVTCPECGATTHASGDLVKCQYCGTESHVQRRTQVLQRPIPVPQQRLPVAVQQRNQNAIATLIGVGTLVAVVPLVATVLVHATKEQRFARQAVATQAAAPTVYQQWRMQRPLLLDVDGDGREDAIGTMTFAGGRTATVLTARSGADGHVLWEVPSIDSPLIAAAKGTILVGPTSDAMRLEAREPATGKLRWQITPQEVVAKLCRDRGDDRVVLETKDEAQVSVELATGAVTPIKKKVACKWLPSTEAPSTDNKHWAYSPPGMQHSQIIGDPTSWIITGYKSPGSEVPMVAAIDDAEHVKWKTTLPTTDIVTAKPITFSYPGLDDTVVATGYARGDKIARLVGLERATGERLFDVELNTKNQLFVPMFTATVGPTMIFVVLGQTLQVYDKKTGAARWMLGN